METAINTMIGNVNAFSIDETICLSNEMCLRLAGVPLILLREKIRGCNRTRHRMKNTSLIINRRQNGFALDSSYLYKVIKGNETIHGNGSGVGGSGMLDEEEIMNLLEEKEMVELELEVCGNVTDQEDQYKLDEEALNLELEEEEREARVEQ
nr:EEIG1/EHBP1 N-terminal domain-containing protein [Tanacetum cinerariifolium]